MEDWISLFIIPYTMIPYGVALYVDDIRWVYLGFLVLVSMTTTDVVKRLSHNLPYLWLKRPSGAQNCNTLLTDGDQSGRPGFPSGHCTGAATFWVGVWMLTPPAYKTPVGVVALLGIASMMWARQKKRCHTALQTIAGVVVGTTYALFL
jgi:membrane-associated phospholipid phosphatase